MFLDEVQKGNLLSNHDEHYLYGKTDNYTHLIYTALNNGHKTAADFLISKIKDSDPLSFLFFNLISSHEDVYSKIIGQMKLNVNAQPALSMFSLSKLKLLLFHMKIERVSPVSPPYFQRLESVMASSQSIVLPSSHT